MLFRIVCFNNLNKSKSVFQVIQPKFYFKSENLTFLVSWKVDISLGTNKVIKLHSNKRSFLMIFFFNAYEGMYVPEQDLQKKFKVESY